MQPCIERNRSRPLRYFISSEPLDRITVAIVLCFYLKFVLDRKWFYAFILKIVEAFKD